MHDKDLAQQQLPFQWLSYAISIYSLQEMIHSLFFLYLKSEKYSWDTQTLFIHCIRYRAVVPPKQ